MRGIVYKIKIPTGEFYIGGTKRELRLRMTQHIRGDNAGYENKKSRLFKKIKINRLMKMVSILYIGDSFADYEGYLIDKSIDSPNSLNTIKPKYDNDNATRVHDLISKYSIKL